MKYKWYVDSGQENNPDKLPRDESSSTSLADFHLSKAEYSHPVTARQLISHCIHKLLTPNSCQILALEIWEWCWTLGISIHAEHSTTLWQMQSWGRVRSEWLEATRESPQSTSKSMESLRSGPLCSTGQQTAPSLFQIQIWPRNRGSGCPGSVLVRSATLCFLSVYSDTGMPLEVGAGTSERISIDSTSVAKPDMVSNSSDKAHQPSNLAAKFQDHHKSSGRDTPIDRAKHPAPGWLQFLWNKEFQLNLIKQRA